HSRQVRQIDQPVAVPRRPIGVFAICNGVHAMVRLCRFVQQLGELGPSVLHGAAAYLVTNLFAVGSQARSDRTQLPCLGVEPYSPERWHDFFLMVGGGAAALTGLVVVAMSLHLDVIVGDPALRHRGRSILTGLAGVFMRCALVLMGGQNGQAVAVE